MEDRQGFIEQSVMDAIADDYEDFDMVCTEVSKWAKVPGGPVTRREIRNALHRVIADGYAQAYVYSPELQRYEVTSYSADQVNQLWFYLTRKGKLLLDHPRH
jgi:hypothetical protein